MRLEFWLQSLLPIRVITSVDMDSIFSDVDTDRGGLMVVALENGSTVLHVRYFLFT